jgi:hypothetical protein
MNELDMAIHHLALGQHGLITAADLARLGITPNGVARRIATGQWQRLAHGVWRLTTQPTSWLQRLHTAQLALGPHALISHRSAAILHGFDGFDGSASQNPANPTNPTNPDHPVDVLVSWPARGRKGPWTLHVLGRSQQPPRRGLDSMFHRPSGLWVTTPARTVLDLSTLGLPDEQLLKAITSAIRSRAASTQFLESLLARRTGSRHPGTAQLRRLLHGPYAAE